MGNVQMREEGVLDKHIIDSVRGGTIREQKDLQAALISRGYRIPQATLSRRLKRLGIAKVNGVYTVVDVFHKQTPLVLEIQWSESGLIVLHTPPGQASGVGYFIDQKYGSGSDSGGRKYDKKEGHRNIVKRYILGTIAGDDTVLVITKGKEALEEVLAMLSSDFPYVKQEE